MDPDVTVRAFLALPLVPHFQEEVSPLVEKLKREHPEVRWVQPAEIHVTLHFFGSIRQEVISKISSRVTPVTQQARPFEIFLRGVGAFPNPQQARVIWVGIEGETEILKSLRAALEESLRKADFSSETREFRPHLTLGRVREGKRFAGFSGTDFGPTVSKRISELVLFESHLTPQGAHYEPIETYPLSST